jgi:hypothetical protein
MRKFYTHFALFTANYNEFSNDCTVLNLFWHDILKGIGVNIISKL